MVQKELHSAVGREAGQAPEPRPGALFLTTLWFGLVAGWLELGFVLAHQALVPRVSLSMVRTNRHYVWMVPVSDVLIFGVAGVAIALLARFRPGLARWTALRLPAAMAALGLLLTVEGLYPIASAILACGLAAQIGRCLERRSERLDRIVWRSLPTMAVALLVLSGFGYGWVASAERRALAARPAASPGLPNVLLIVLDTVRAASLGLYGHECPNTPNLERLARQGIVFSHARSTAPWTLPSHASMFTGRWPHELSLGPDSPLDESCPTLAEVLSREGYATAGFVGNVFYCSSRYGIGRGFARYEGAYENRTISLFEIVWSSGLGRRVIQGLGFPIHPDDGWTAVRKTAAMLNRDVLAWLDNRPGDEPFFAFINYYDAHRPYAMDWDGDLRFGLAALPPGEQRKIDERFMDLAAGKPLPPDLDPDSIISQGYKLYYDAYDSRIAYLDRHVGLLVDEINRRGLLDNTLVIVTSDHGEQLGEHGFIAHGASVYREETHVPLLIIPPARSSSAKVISEPVSLREIPATIADWTGLGPRNPFPGRSLSRYLQDGAARPADTSPVFCELQHNMLSPTVRKPSLFEPLCCLVSRGHVYIRGDGGHEELYELASDPYEVDNLARYVQSRPLLERLREDLSRVRRGEDALVR
jgi:arylsulfatase A-like enzyme